MSVDVRVEIDLDQIPTMDLLTELNSRHKLDKREVAGLDVFDLIEILEQNDCPKELVKQLHEWNDQPIVTKEKLKLWVESCNQSRI